MEKTESRGEKNGGKIKIKKMNQERRRWKDVIH